jgi:hypothetical protein
LQPYIEKFIDGQLEHFVRDHFPHIWQNTPEAQRLFANFGKRPRESSKSAPRQHRAGSRARAQAGER